MVIYLGCICQEEMEMMVLLDIPHASVDINAMPY